MTTKEFLGIAGLIGLAFLVIKKKLFKKEKKILGTFKYPGDVENLLYIGNGFDSILVNDKLVYYSEKMPNLSNLKNKNVINLERRAEELVINLRDVVISDIHTLTIEKKGNKYFTIILRRSSSSVISGYLLKEEEG